MKKILLITLIGAVPVFAQAKKGAKPKKEEVATAAQPQQAAATASAEKKEEIKPWTIGGYVLYNIPSGTLVDRSNIDKGGPLIGAHIFHNFSLLSVGASGSILPISLETSGADPATTVFFAFDGLVRLRLYGFYVGALAGYAMGQSRLDSGKSTGSLGNGISYGANAGYVLTIGSIGIHVGADLRFISYSWSGVSGTLTNITPKIGVDYSF